MKGENEPHGGKRLPAGLAPIIIIGVALVVLAVLSLVTESDIITNLVFAFGVIFIVLTVRRLVSNQAQERRRQMTTQNGARTNKQGAPHKTRRPKDQRRKPPGKVGTFLTK